MPKLIQAPKKLSIKEISTRFKKNPEDPIVLEEINRFAKTERPRLLIVAKAIEEGRELLNSFSKSNEFLTIVKAYNKLPPRSFFNEIAEFAKRRSFTISKVFEESQYVISSLNKEYMGILPALNNLTDNHNRFIENLGEIKMPILKTSIAYSPAVNYMPARTNYYPTLRRIEDQLDQLIEDKESPDEQNINTVEDKIFIFPVANKKNKKLRKMLNLIVKRTKVEIFHLAQCIEPKLTRTKFKNDRSFPKRVEYAIRILREKVGKYRCEIKLRSGYYEFIRNNSS